MEEKVNLEFEILSYDSFVDLLSWTVFEDKGVLPLKDITYDYYPQLKEIEDYAYKNNIPIMQMDGIEFLTNYIKENNIKNILEIGSAIGYSAIKMALVSDNIKITTIERDKERFDIAINNIKKIPVIATINTFIIFNCFFIAWLS